MESERGIFQALECIDWKDIRVAGKVSELKGKNHDDRRVQRAAISVGRNNGRCFHEVKGMFSKLLKCWYSC